jgi:hypothetical protein
MSHIGWGVDGYGNRHYNCSYCELYFGPNIDPDEINHDCDTSKPRYHNRGVMTEQAKIEVRYLEKARYNKQAAQGINFHSDR